MKIPLIARENERKINTYRAVEMLKIFGKSQEKLGNTQKRMENDNRNQMRANAVREDSQYYIANR